MGKIITIPTWLGADHMKNVASIPSKANIVVVDSTHIDCSFINMNYVKAFFNATSNSLSALCQLPSINEYARFRPNGLAPYRIGDFAGYNHNAMPPSYFSSKDAISTNKTYVSSGVYSFKVNASVLRGEREPLHSNSEISWGVLALKFEYGGQTIWKTINVDSIIQTTNNYAEAEFTTSNPDAESIEVHITAYYTDLSSGDPGTVQLIGYGDGHTYGKVIEDGSFYKTVNLSEVPSANFTGTFTWNSTKKELTIGNFDPSYYNYTYGSWYAINGSITSSSGASTYVGLTSVGGIPNSGDFGVTVTAQYPGLRTITNTFTISIRNNVLAAD